MPKTSELEMPHDEHILPRNFPPIERLELFAKEIPTMDPWAHFLLNEMQRVMRLALMHLDRNFADYGISTGRYVVLLAIAEAGPEGIASSVMADQLNVTRATVTGLLDNLERDGLVDRLRRKDDKRRVDVFLTKKGQALMKSMMPDHCERVASAMGGLTNAEKRQMIEYLHKIEDGATKFSS